MRGEYATCAEWGIDLLPTIESFEVLQMFLLSLQRLHTTPVGGGWKAAEALQQLAPQILVSHEHLPRLNALLEITLGVRVPDSLPEEIADAATRTRALYYGGACLIASGQTEKAPVAGAGQPGGPAGAIRVGPAPADEGSERAAE